MVTSGSTTSTLLIFGPISITLATMASRIGPDIRIAGALVASEDLSIAGIVEGTVTVLGALTIERGAQIHGEVTARDVVIHGELHVAVRASASVRLGPTAVLCGELSAARIIVEEGAVLEGNVRTTRNLDSASLRPVITAAVATPALAVPSVPASREPALAVPKATPTPTPVPTPREPATPSRERTHEAMRPRSAPTPPSTPVAIARASEPRRAADRDRGERDRNEREIPELPTIGRQKLVRR